MSGGSNSWVAAEAYTALSVIKCRTVKLVLLAAILILASGCSNEPSYCAKLEDLFRDARTANNDLTLSLAEADAWRIFLDEGSAAALDIQGAAAAARDRGRADISYEISVELAQRKLAEECGEGTR